MIIRQGTGIDQLSTLNAHQLELLSRYQITTPEALYGQFIADRKSLADLLGMTALDLNEMERELNAAVPEDIRMDLKEKPTIYLPSPLPIT